MNQRFAILVTAGCFAWCGMAFAADPMPVPPVTITAPATATGDGTQQSPYVFALGAKGDLRLAVALEKVVVDWKLRDAPAETEIIDSGKRLWFPTDTPGLYVAFASWVDGDKPAGAVCWFQIKGPNGPPPVPTPSNAIVTQLKAALVGPDVKADAQKLSGLCGGFADAIQAGAFPTYKEMFAAWKASQAAAQWPAGKYPAMPAIFRLAIPTMDETTPLNSTNTPSIISNLRLIEKTAGAIANG